MSSELCACSVCSFSISTSNWFLIIDLNKLTASVKSVEDSICSCLLFNSSGFFSSGQCTCKCGKEKPLNE